MHLVPEYRLANSGALGVKSTGSSAPCSRSSRGRARAAVIQAAKPGEAPGTRAARRPCRPGPSLPPPRRRAEMSLSHRLPPGAPAVDPYYVYAPRPDPHRQGVLTLFVAGLPDDVKPREIHNLFSHRPGFDHCLLEYTGRGNQVRPPSASRSSLGSRPVRLRGTARLNPSTGCLLCEPLSSSKISL